MHSRNCAWIYILINIICIINIIVTQESCIFGDTDDCYFPCKCESVQNANVSCDPVSGQCYSGQCDSGYSMSSSICQPSGGENIYFVDYGIAIFLVHPTTGRRLTDDLYTTLQSISRNGDRRNHNCTGLVSLEQLELIDGSLIWEFDFIGFYKFDINKIFIGPSQLRDQTVRVEFRNDSGEAGLVYQCRLDDYVIECYSNTNVIARHVYLIFPQLQQYKCVRFRRFRLNRFLRVANTDCSRCPQNEAPPCGNGIWCETCAAGWRPPDCRKSCEIGYSGINCLETYYFDWLGSSDVVEVSPTSLTIEYKCDVLIPAPHEHYFEIRIQLLQNDVYETIATLPYDTNVTSVEVSIPIQGQTCSVRLVLFVGGANVTAYGLPSNVIRVFLPQDRTVTNHNGGSNNAQRLNGFEIAFAITLLLLIVVIVYCIVHRYRKGETLLPCSNENTRSSTSRQAVYENTTRIAPENPVLQTNNTLPALQSPPMDSCSQGDFYELTNAQQTQDNATPNTCRAPTSERVRQHQEPTYQGTYANLRDPEIGPNEYATVNS